MKHGITGIDHPVIAVRDLDAAKMAYARLGFTVTARGSHAAWGTGNYCAMFERDYLELRGIVRATDHTKNLESFLAVEEGLMGVALGTCDAEATCASLAAAGWHPKPVHRLSRDFELPEGTTHPAFVISSLEESETPGLMSVVLCQHLTPDLLRRPEWTRHANGAVGVRSMTAVVDDLEAAASAHRKLFGDEAVLVGGGDAVVRVGPHSSFVLMTALQWERAFPGRLAHRNLRPPFLAAVTLEVCDLQSVRSRVAARAIRCLDDSDCRLIVDPAEACGVMLEFRSPE